MNKKIRNVVFYSFHGERGKMHQACIFYTDGTVENVSHEEGLEAAYIIADEENIKTREDFLNSLNKKRIYSITGKELEKRFKEFMQTSVVPVDTGRKSITKTKTNKSETNTSSSNKGKKKKKGLWAKIKKNCFVKPIIEAGTAIGLLVGGFFAKRKHKNKKKNNIFSRTWSKIKNRNKNKNKNKTNKKKGLWAKIKKNKFIKPVVAAITAISLLIGGFFLGKNVKNSNTNNNTSISSETDSNVDSSENIEAQDLAYLKLVNTTTNKAQRKGMKQQGTSLDLFNRDFADEYVQSGSNVKAALTWDEMMALNLAYNSYTKDQIRSMFNGAELDSKAMGDAYKNATLQLIASYVIETRENPVNSSKFLITKEEQAFVEKYNDLFLKCKEATGENQISAVNVFYKELYKDFPISNEIREEGISHADGRKQLDSYKLAITPIVGAAELMFQNLDIDHTLSDKAIDYFNDLGLCNIAEEKFEKAMTITLSAETDDSIPTYDEFKNAKIEELKFEDNYVIDDNYRDLSQLDEFQKWVNGHFEIVNGVNTGKVVYNTKTKSKTTTNNSSTYKTTSNRNTAVKESGEKAVKNAENKVDSQISSENAASKTTAEQQAEQNRQSLQQQADKDKAEKETKVEAIDKELQDKINNANSSSSTTNEGDFGDHNVSFSPEHSDQNGNLNDSVTDITTDGTGDQTGEPLPDPNVTGAEFDAQSKTITYTNEQLINAYIDELEKGSETVESGYQYKK